MRIVLSMINRKTFYDAVRESLFSGRLDQAQVDGMEAILDAWESLQDTEIDPDDSRHRLAYVLATALHETAHTMQPIEEYGKGRGRRYGAVHQDTGYAYYGRGFVQLTWRENYEKLSRIVGVNLVKYPEQALNERVASKIIIVGMSRGLFTGVGLDRYFTGGHEDPYNARRIVNGTDRARRIAGYYEAFDDALEAGLIACEIDARSDAQLDMLASKA